MSRWLSVTIGVLVICCLSLASQATEDTPEKPADPSPTGGIKYFRMASGSMQPNVKEKELLKISLLGENDDRSALLKRGDIVLFDAPGEEKRKQYIKRLIALPGDTITVRSDALSINDVEITKEKLREDIYEDLLGHKSEIIIYEETLGDRKYLVQHSRDQIPIDFGQKIVAQFPFCRIDPSSPGSLTCQLPNDPLYCFVLGDNRDNSLDSRYFGPLRLDEIHGIIKKH